jgi:hypothetical protein
MIRRLGIIQKDNGNDWDGSFKSAVYPTGLRRLAFSVVAEECFIDNMTIPESTFGLWWLFCSCDIWTMRCLDGGAIVRPPRTLVML